MRNRQAGLTLIETVLVLIVAALIIGGIWVAYSQVRLNQQVNDTVAVLDETLQVTRDYLSSQSTVPSNLSQALYNPAAGVSLMPTRLSYAGPASIAANLGGVNSGAQIFLSPLGADFFVQYPNGATLPVKYFEVRIGFLNSGNVYIDQCLQLMPKIIGTISKMNDRGLVGYWYGGNNGTTMASWLTGAGPNPTPGQVTTALATLSTSSTTQLSACSGANDVRLYFAMRP